MQPWPVTAVTKSHNVTAFFHPTLALLYSLYSHHLSTSISSPVGAFKDEVWHLATEMTLEITVVECR